MTDQRVNHPRPGALAPVRRSSGMLVFLALFVAPSDARSQLAPTTEPCIRVEVRNDQFLDVNIRPYVNGIAVGEKLYVQGLRSGSFSLRAATYLNAQLQFAIDPVGSSEVHFVPGHSGLHIASTSTLVEIRVASRIWLSTLSLVDLEDPPSGCPPTRQAARSGREIDPAHLDILTSRRSAVRVRQRPLIKERISG
ncbi:MAG: hypothetical protein OXH49_11450 [Gemmatimonadetes bacterium]|nr:hypothetical protein [Gemmatimonadota bacterium]